MNNKPDSRTRRGYTTNIRQTNFLVRRLLEKSMVIAVDKKKRNEELQRSWSMKDFYREAITMRQKRTLPTEQQ